MWNAGARYEKIVRILKMMELQARHMFSESTHNYAEKSVWNLFGGH